MAGSWSCASFNVLKTQSTPHLLESHESARFVSNQRDRESMAAIATPFTVAASSQ
ncbi:hypothetical protein [Halomicronema sp. CCY15110]|uniref:hypothetical protein n=1 Tax=Halomicronema sp. CCY15110 TaxID=2767773 RepID=UPI001951CA67|nr:hypothetical protein [Halomicronema sp. CCY15110]